MSPNPEKEAVEQIEAKLPKLGGVCPIHGTRYTALQCRDDQPIWVCCVACENLEPELEH
jgi:hypothetical protein